MTEALFPAGCALVIGGSGGIGGVVASEFARSGTSVALSYRNNRDKAEANAVAIRKLGVAASTHEVTMGDQASVNRMVQEALAQHGRIHTAVYAAAMLTEQVDLADVTHEQWDQAINQDLNGFFNLFKATIHEMRAKGGGSYVNLGSAGDLWWPEKDGLSVAPKGTIEALVRGIAKEEGKHKVRANSVMVGVIEAGMFLELTKQGVFDENWTREVQKNLCLKRWGQPEEIGHACVFLASNKAAYVTGQQLAVAGGFGV